MINKKIISITIILSILISTLGGATPIFSSSPPIGDVDTYENISSASIFRGSLTWLEYKMKEGLPSDLPERNVNNLLFNYEIYQDIGLIVFGDFSDVPNNDFKSGTQPDPTQPIIPDTGYYINNGKRGMYRYSGWTKSGNTKVTTPNFVADKSSSSSIQSKNWFYRWFDPNVQSYIQSEFSAGSDFKSAKISIPTALATEGVYGSGLNKVTISDEEQQYLREWIGNTVSDPIQKGTQTGYDRATDLNPYNYLNVDSEPTTRFSGKTRAYHLSGGGMWYYNLNLNPIERKIETDLEAEFINTEQSLTDDKYTVKTTLTGELIEKIFNNDIEKSLYYNKSDIESWTFQIQENINNTVKTQEGVRTSWTTAESDFIFEYGSDVINNYKDVNGNVNIGVTLYGRVEVNIANGDVLATMLMINVSDEGVIVSEMSEPEPREQGPFNIDVEFEAPTKMLDIDTFDINIIEGNTDSLDRKEVKLDGEILTGIDKENFLNGNYKFPIIGETKVYDYEIIYHQIEPLEPVYIKSFVNVYDHRPDANSKFSGGRKENRVFGVSTDIITPEYVEERSPTRISNITLSSSDGTLYTRNDTGNSIEAMLDDVGTVHLNYTVSNDFGSRSYSKELFIAEDYRPDIIAQVWNPQMLRNENLDLYFSAVSTDGDEIDITSNTYKILKDSNNDGNYDTILEQGSFDPSTPPTFSTTELGKFAIEFSTREQWTAETMEEYVTISDYKTHTDTVYFEVINSTPINNVDTDFDYEFPQADIFTIIDSNINDTTRNDLLSQRIDFNNMIRRQGIDANSEMWDTKIYIYTTTGSKTLNTGGSYPPASTNYSDVNGYTGIIPRTNVSNDEYKVDEGRYRTKTTCTTEKVKVGAYCPKADDFLCYVMGGWVPIYEYEEVCETDRYWDSDWTWYDDYTGYYSGPVSKDVKQEWNYTARDKSEKVLVYYTDNNINNLTDLNHLKNLYPDNIIIEVSPINSGNNDLHIPYSTNENNIYMSIAEYLKGELPEVEGMTILKGETLNFYTSSIDDENDPLLKVESQIVHDNNYYDTPDTLFSLATGTTYADNNYSGNDIPATITPNKAGKYQIYRRITDIPNGDVNYSEVSNEAMLEFYVHRKPQADFYLDWTYNPSGNNYQLTWIDESFDPDFVNDINRGVIDRKLKYRKIGDTDWTYGEPTLLPAGNYEMEYIVQDIYGEWSDVNYRTFTLDATPPPQLIQADLEVVDNSFSLSSIPVTEHLRWSDVITRFPYQEQLRIEIRDDSNVLRRTYIRTNNDPTINNLNWNNQDFQIIPDTLPDGNYRAYIIVEDSANTSNNTSKMDSFVIDTPVDLVITDNVSSLSYDTVRFEVETSRYVNDVRGTILEGTPHESTVSFTYEGMNGDKKVWYHNYDTATSIAEGDYTISYRAETTNGNVETVSKNVEVIWLKINSITVAPSDPMRGDNIIVTVDSSGGADIARITIDTDMQSTEGRSQVATHLTPHGGFRNKIYQTADGVYEYDIDENTNNKVNVFEFVTDINFPINIVNGSQVVAPYTIEIEIERGSMTRSATFQLNFEGDVRETLKVN